MASRSYGASVLCQKAAAVRMMRRVSVIESSIFIMEVRQMGQTDKLWLFVAKQHCNKWTEFSSIHSADYLGKIDNNVFRALAECNIWINLLLNTSDFVLTGTSICFLELYLFGFLLKQCHNLCWSAESRPLTIEQQNKPLRHFSSFPGVFNCVLILL